MNDRQYKLLVFLLNNDQYVTIQELADLHQCSEKTIRNDFKIIDQWLQQKSNGILIRKPNIGVYLQVDPFEKKKLLNEISKEKILTEDERKKEILKWLLRQEKEITIEDLVKQFYVSKSVIRKDLENIEKWLNRFGLQLIRKTKVGIKVEGEEKLRRFALSKIYDDWFEPYEISLVKKHLLEFEQLFTFSFSDEAIKNLIIHILISIKRIKLGHYIKMDAENLKQIQNQKEYHVALQLAERLKKAFVINFPPAEIAFIASHLSGAKIRYDYLLLQEGALSQLDKVIIQFAKELIEEVSKITGENFFNDQELFIGLAIHLQSALNRLKYHLSLTNPLASKIKKMYRYMFEVVISVIPFIQEKTNFFIPEDEISYIVLHFQASVEKRNNRVGSNKKAIIVCHMGIGMSQLLKTKLERKFQSLQILDVVPASGLNKALEKNKPDFIISTIPIENKEIRTITVTPLFSEQEQKKLENFILELEYVSKQAKYPTLKSFIHQELVFLDVDFNQYYELIEFLANALAEKGYVSIEYKESVIKREQVGSTAVGGEIAIPHGDPKLVIHSTIAVARLKRTIDLNGEKINFVFLMATKLAKSDQIQILFHEIVTLVENEKDLERLKDVNTVNEFLNNL
ncbi:transcription antiterminator [Tepidibacillus infernus]|uniref:BglG family transcription antiterminator n=1 Tax=Tepidibacillus infernus TaxID=1806172 RepID=UPI003B70EF66